MSLISQLLQISNFITNHPLNKSHKTKALLKFLKWEVATRLLGMKVIVPWVENSRFIAGVGETGLTGNLYSGFMEYEDMLFLLHALQPNEVFVDVGANIGAYTILASKVVNSKSISFEPLPETVDRLKDQIHINRIEQIVDIKNMGVGNKTGSLFFTNNNDTINKVSISGDVANTTRVEVTTLDNELIRGGRYFLKIDVEGFEYNVLEGGSSLLATSDVSAIIIELNGSGDEFGHSNEAVHQKLIGFNFVPVTYDPIKRKLTKIQSYNQNGGNTIYIKNYELMSERCKAAPKRIIHTAFGTTI